MAQIKKGYPHGLAFAQVALVGTNGRAYGTAGPSQANGVVSGAYLIDDPISGELPIPDRTTIDFTGGDRWLGSYQYGITSLGSFTLGAADIDATLIAMVTGSKVDQTTNQKWTMYSENVLKDRLPQVCVMLTFRIQSRESGTDGGDFFITYVIPRAWMAPKGTSGAPGFQSKGQYSFQITPTAGGGLPIGVPFTQANQGWQNNKTPILAVISDNPIGLATFIADGTLTDFTLPYLPVTSTVASGNAGNLHALNGAITGLSAVDTSTGEVTLLAAGSAANYHGLMYETNFIPSA